MLRGEEPLEKTDYEALAAFRHRLRCFLRYADEGAREAGITAQQHQLLLAIKGQPGRDWAFVHEVAEGLQIRHHAAVGLIDRSEQAGLVQRTPDPDDRRRVRLSLTERGEEVLEKLSRRNRSELQALRRSLQVPFLDLPAPED